MTSGITEQPTQPCACACHSNRYASCTVDTGSSGVPGLPSCSPCNQAPSSDATHCELCGEQIGAPHKLRGNDCVMAHPDHVERFVGQVCKRHYHWIDNTLTQITELFALRGYVVYPKQSGMGGTRSKSMDPPAPGRIEIMALTDKRSSGNPLPMTYERNWNGRTLETNGDDLLDVPGTLTSWARMVIEERNPAELTAMPDGTVTAAIRILRRERHWIAAQSWVDDYAQELTDLHLALARGIGDSMWPKSIGKCPNCGHRLFNTIGVDVVTCTNKKCDSVWEGIALVRLRLILEQEAV